MKTIEEAAEEMYKSVEVEIGMSITQYEFFLIYSAGAKFTQRWIPVEEELPEDNEAFIILPKCNFDATKTIKVLAMTDMGTITDNRRIKMQVGEKEWVWFMDYDGEIVTHWRQIEIK